MVENKNEETNSVQTERFQFVLSMNDFIICQRYFKIGGFKDRSVESTDLLAAGNKCVEMIKDDLKWKTATYMKYSAPLIYASKEEMDNSLAKQEKKAIDPEFILIRDTEEMFVWDGETLTPYEGRFNKSDYLTKDEDTLPLKFEFLVDNRPVYSELIDMSPYPRFVRNNIDLSNKKIYYRSRESMSGYDYNMLCLITKDRNDIIFPIICELANVCSFRDSDDYRTVLTDNVGMVWVNQEKNAYTTDISRQNHKYLRKVENEYYKKQRLQKHK